jgi:hypothetical protein
MADEGIKKVIIKNEDLPPVQITTTFNDNLNREEVASSHYDFRYRIISEDKNRFSHWSQIIRYPMPDVTAPFPYTGAPRFVISKSGNPEVINAVWSFPGDVENPSDYVKIFRKTRTYDVWIRWNNNNESDPNATTWTPWQFETSVSSNNFSIPKLTLAQRIEIAIQVPTTVKIRDYYNNKLTLFRAISPLI